MYLTGFVLWICGLLLLCFVGAGFGLNSKYLGVSGSVSPQLVVSPPLDSFSFQLFYFLFFNFIFNDIFIFWLWTWILGTGGSILILFFFCKLYFIGFPWLCGHVFWWYICSPKGEIYHPNGFFLEYIFVIWIYSNF